MWKRYFILPTISIKLVFFVAKNEIYIEKIINYKEDRTSVNIRIQAEADAPKGTAG